MAISDEIHKIRDKFDPKTNIIDEWNNHSKELRVSKICKNIYAYSLGKCAHCGICGREFDDEGNLIKEAE